MISAGSKAAGSQVSQSSACAATQNASVFSPETEAEFQHSRYEQHLDELDWQQQQAELQALIQHEPQASGVARCEDAAGGTYPRLNLPKGWGSSWEEVMGHRRGGEKTGSK